MDLRSENNLDSRLKNVLLHHNAIRKGLKKKIYKKDELKKKLLKNCSRNSKVRPTNMVKIR